MKVLVFPDSSSLAKEAANFLIRRAKEALSERSRFFLALSGGSTPSNMYEELSSISKSEKDNTHWEKSHIFFSDERVVPLDHPLSNYGLAHRLLNIPAQFYPASVDLPSPQAVANDYETQVRTVLSREDGAIPRFDLLVLGMGTDAHTASLFPFSSALDETNRLVMSAESSDGLQRVTFTLPLINRARAVLVLVTGHDKAETMAQVLSDRQDKRRWPIQNLVLDHGSVTFFLDDAAASHLSESSFIYSTLERNR